MLFTTISPAPSVRAATHPLDRVHAGGGRAPSMNTSYPLGMPSLAPTCFTCVESTMHWVPNASAPARMMSGLRTAIESTLIFSAPALSTVNMSSRSRMPPPTVNGTKTCSATSRTVSRSIGPALRARHDVVEDDLVDLVGVEPLRELGRGRDVDVVLELLGLGDPAVDDVEARDEPLGQHDAPSQVAKLREHGEPDLAALLGVELGGRDVAGRDHRAERHAVLGGGEHRVGVGRDRVEAVDEVAVRVGSGQPATSGWLRVTRTSFHPIWGTRSVSGNRRTTPGTQPRQSAGPSSLRSKSTWSPMQMPRNGTRRRRPGG